MTSVHSNLVQSRQYALRQHHSVTASATYSMTRPALVTAWMPWRRNVDLLVPAGTSTRLDWIIWMEICPFAQALLLLPLDTMVTLYKPMHVWSQCFFNHNKSIHGKSVHTLCVFVWLAINKVASYMAMPIRRNLGPRKLKGLPDAAQDQQIIHSVVLVLVPRIALLHHYLL
jgi:hypothetical protein